jgi:CreA protein
VEVFIIADTSGINGRVGLAEDPSWFLIACRAVGPIAVSLGLPKSEAIDFSSASLFFTTFRIYRAIHAEKSVLVYSVVSTKLMNGSQFNSTRSCRPGFDCPLSRRLLARLGVRGVGPLP